MYYAASARTWPRSWSAERNDGDEETEPLDGQSGPWRPAAAVPAGLGGRHGHPSTNIPTRDGAPKDIVSFHTSVYVHAVPVRIWHRVNAAEILVQIATGHFMGSPLPLMQISEAT